jgi:hypothetical protein
MGLPARQVECLLMAILAVNSFSLEKAWKLLPGMRELTSAGYDRKRLTWLFAERVKALMAAVDGASWMGSAR